MDAQQLQAVAATLKDLAVREKVVADQITALKADRDALMAAGTLTVAQDRELAGRIEALALEAHQVRDVLAAVRG